MQKLSGLQQEGKQELQLLQEEKSLIIQSLKKLFKSQSLNQQNNFIQNAQENEFSLEEKQTNEQFGWNIDKKQQNSSIIHTFKEWGNNLYLFDTKTQKHKTVKTNLQIQHGYRSVEYQNKIYLIEGNKTWRLNYDGTFDILNQLKYPRKFFGIAAAQGKIFVAGGKFKEKPLKTAESLNLTKNGQWESIADIPNKI